MHAMAPPPEVVAHPANNARDTVDDEQTHPAASLGTDSPLQHDAFTRLPARGSAASACILLLTASVLGAVTRQVARLATRVAQATAAAAATAAAVGGAPPPASQQLATSPPSAATSPPPTFATPAASSQRAAHSAPPPSPLQPQPQAPPPARRAS